MDLEKPGAMYKSLVSDTKDEHAAPYPEDKNQKVTNIIEHMEFLFTSAPIKKLLKEEKWQVEYQKTLKNNFQTYMNFKIHKH